MIKAILGISAALYALAFAICNWLLSGLLFELGTFSENNLYFFNGNFILTPNTCFLENGELMIQSFFGYSYTSIGIYYILGVLTGIAIIIVLIARLVRKILSKTFISSKSSCNKQ